MWEGWFLSAVEEEITRINIKGRAVVNKSIELDTFLARGVNVFESGFVFLSDKTSAAYLK